MRDGILNIRPEGHWLKWIIIIIIIIYSMGNGGLFGFLFILPCLISRHHEMVDVGIEKL